MPTDGKSTKGPVGGSSCSFRAAFWTLEGHDVEVMVTLPPVTYVSISVLSKSGNPAGNGAGSILAGRIGADINVTVRGSTKGIGVSLAASGAVSGLCAVPKLG